MPDRRRPRVGGTPAAQVKAPHTRPATPADAQALADLRVRAMRPSLEKIGRFDPKGARDRFLANFRPEDTQVLVDGDLILGVIVVRLHPDHLYLDHLYVDPSAQGLGLGRKVLTDLKTRARAAGMPIRLIALNDSSAAEFYRTNGFRETDRDALDTRFEWSPHRVETAH